MINTHGSKALPGVVRNGDDNGQAGYTGYEDGAINRDVMAFGSVSGDIGSPLMGHYGGAPVNPTLSLTGQCPGTIDIDASGLTPNGSLTVLTATTIGKHRDPGRPLRGGTDSGLGMGIVVRATPTANANGALSISPNIPQGLCGDFIAVLDQDSCTMSNAEQF